MNIPGFTADNAGGSSRDRMVVPQRVDLNGLKDVAQEALQKHYGKYCYHKPYCLDECYFREGGSGSQYIGGYKVAMCLNDCCS